MKEIFFHYSEFKGDLEALQAGDDVEFTIKDRNVCFCAPLRNLVNSSVTSSIIRVRYCDSKPDPFCRCRGKRWPRTCVCSLRGRLFLRISVLNSLKAQSPRLSPKFPLRIRYASDPGFAVDHTFGFFFFFFTNKTFYF